MDFFEKKNVSFVGSHKCENDAYTNEWFPRSTAFVKQVIGVMHGHPAQISYIVMYRFLRQFNSPSVDEFVFVKALAAADELAPEVAFRRFIETPSESRTLRAKHSTRNVCFLRSFALSRANLASCQIRSPSDAEYSCHGTSGDGPPTSLSLLSTLPWLNKNFAFCDTETQRKD